MTIQHKSKNLEQISENYRLYDETLKKKYQETAQKFKALREENKTLKDEIVRDCFAIFFSFSSLFVCCALVRYADVTFCLCSG